MFINDSIHVNQLIIPLESNKYDSLKYLIESKSLQEEKLKILNSIN